MRATLPHACQGMPVSSIVRVAFVGCGGAGSAHRNNVATMPDARIVAVADVAEDRAASVGQKHACPAFSDWRRMLAEVPADAVYVAVPPTGHGELELAILETGAALYVEKPLALDIAVAARIAATIQRRKAIATVGYQLRYSPSTQAIATWLQTRPVGLVSAFYYTGLPGGPWWRDRAQSGGQTVEQTTHMIDLIRYLGGEVAEITTRGALRILGDAPGINVDDVTAHLMRLDSGAVASLVQTCALGHHGGMGLDIVAGGDLIRWRPAGATLITSHEETFVGSPADPMMEADTAFIRAVADGDPSGLRCTYADGLRTLAVTLAANRSAEEGLPVRPTLD